MENTQQSLQQEQEQQRQRQRQQQRQQLVNCCVLMRAAGKKSGRPRVELSLVCPWEPVTTAAVTAATATAGATCLRLRL